MEGIGDNNAALARRVAALERMLGLYREENVVVLSEDGRTKRCSILLRGAGTANISLGGSVDCILGDLLDDPSNAGKKMIRPGYVVGGGANIYLEKTNITPTIGDHLYVEISWTGAVEDGVLLTGGSMTAAEIKQGSAIPSDHNFTATSPTGKHYEPLGKWNNNGSGSPVWTPSGCGSLHVGMCSNGKTGTF